METGSADRGRRVTVPCCGFSAACVRTCERTERNLLTLRAHEEVVPPTRLPLSVVLGSAPPRCCASETSHSVGLSRSESACSSGSGVLSGFRRYRLRSFISHHGYCRGGPATSATSFTLIGSPSCRFSFATPDWLSSTDRAPVFICKQFGPIAAWLAARGREEEDGAGPESD